jgi:hypothetical protein
MLNINKTETNKIDINEEQLVMNYFNLTEFIHFLLSVCPVLFFCHFSTYDLLPRISRIELELRPSYITVFFIKFHIFQTMEFLNFYRLDVIITQ